MSARSFRIPSGTVNKKQKYTWLQVLGLLFLVFLCLLSQFQEYYYPHDPFSAGLYRNAIAGRIKILSSEKIIKVRLSTSDSLYYFTPYSMGPEYRNFSSIVRTGDSLWKFPNSNVLYSLGRNGYVYKWTFSLSDRYRRRYTDSSAIDSSVYQ